MNLNVVPELTEFFFFKVSVLSMKNDMNQQVVDFDNKIINNKDIKIILSILSIVNR